MVDSATIKRRCRIAIRHLNDLFDGYCAFLVFRRGNKRRALSVVADTTDAAAEPASPSGNRIEPIFDAIAGR